MGSFGFKKTPFSDCPDAKQLFASQAWNQVKTRLEFLAQHHGVGLITGEVGAGKSTAARVHRHAQYQPLQDSLRAFLLGLGAGPAASDRPGTRPDAGALPGAIWCAWCRCHRAPEPGASSIPYLIGDEAHLLPHSALEQLPLLLNFDMDSSRYLTLLLVGQPLLERTLSLLDARSRSGSGSAPNITWKDSREELDAYLAQQLKAAGAALHTPVVHWSLLHHEVHHSKRWFPLTLTVDAERDAGDVAQSTLMRGLDEGANCIGLRGQGVFSIMEELGGIPPLDDGLAIEDVLDVVLAESQGARKVGAGVKEMDSRWTPQTDPWPVRCPVSI